MPVDPAVFRDAMGHFPSGVCVVTTIDPQSKPWGFTASAFSSLSLEPPLILVCLDRRADSHDAFYSAGSFAVSILASHQVSMAVHFATRGIEKFEGVTLASGQELRLPLIPEAVVHLECSMHQTIPVGDHTILVGNVFHARRYGIMQPHPVV
jgi:flavin reductase ActVB